MKEIREIIKAYDQAVQSGKQAALATVVHLEGSSYRRPGARMLITEEGQLTGAISGGCLEGDALRKALLVMQEKKSKLVTYDTTDDDDAKFGVGLGCNGIIQVLIEPVDIADTNNPIVFLKAINERRQRSVLVTLFNLADKKNPQYGTCLLVREDKTAIDNSPILKDVMMADAMQILAEKYSLFRNYTFEKNTLTAFFELVNPPVSLIIAGAGNDVVPLVKMADILGWEAIVADGRSNYATRDRFAAACQVLVSRPDDLLERVTVDDMTFFLLMTHNYNYDLAMVRQLLQKNVLYVGMLGPKKKKERMLKELEEEGLSFSEKQLAALYSPVGLNIGAETPEEIALSIVAEIKSVISLSHPEPLRNREQSIHDRSTLTIEK